MIETDHHNPSLTQLFISFLRLGSTAFGGPAMVAYIRKLSVEKRRWLDEGTFRTGVSLCQTIPGATAMQMSAYVGLRTRGAMGAAASFVGFGLPAFLLMLLLSVFYAQARALPPAASAFNGLQVLIVAVVANATLSFARSALKGWKTILIAVPSAGLFALGINPILVILLAALAAPLMRAAETTPPMSDRNTSLATTKPLVAMTAAIIAALIILYFAESNLFDLAVLMFRIDLFAFGGGFASVPLMFHEIVKVRSWLPAATFVDGIALGQITPGPIVITATFVGYMTSGLLGACVATVSIFAPSFLLVVGLAPCFDRLRSSPRFNKATNGILCSFVGLLLAVTVRFASDVPWDWPRLLLGSTALSALFLKADILWVILVGVCVSVIVF
jgi:chromate transporter